MATSDLEKSKKTEIIKRMAENSKQKRYSILMPPPNLTGEPHIGHMMQHVILDALARFKRARGFDVLLLPGVDHAGIQFEGTLNKLLAKENLSKEKLGREEWLKRAWKFKDEIYTSFHTTWNKMGISAQWEKEVFTLDPKIANAVFHEFKTFWEENLLYKGAYIVQWCPKDGTAIEDVEMDYEERKEKLYFVKYEIVAPMSNRSDNDEYIVIATARPETIAADVAIAIYPKHPKFKKYIGKKAINPFTKTEITIIEDERVDTEFGTGALKITPGHDLLDYEIGKDHQLEILHAIGKDGKITDLDKDLRGLKIMEAREKAAQKLRDLGLIEKEEAYTHSVPVCERCGTTVEPLISEEWFLKMKSLAQKALENIQKIHFVPENYLAILSDWLSQIHDWSISRSLWWGHRIPVWYCENCNSKHEVGKDKDMIVSMEEPQKNCQTCGAKRWTQDEKILDTWFSSGLWPLATLGWPKKTEEFEKYFPWDFEISAPEIKYLWISRMIMLCLHFTHEIPFKNMFFNGTLRDLQGRKFSKSLGNGLYPQSFMDRWGVDALRMALFSYSAPNRDGRASQQTMDERCKNFRNFATKLKNISRFIYELAPASVPPRRDRGGAREFSHTDDQEIDMQLKTVIAESARDIESFNLHLATDKIYNFVWHQFADIYIERSKQRRSEAQPCLEFVFQNILKLLAPFMPFTTEELTAYNT